MQRSTLIVTHWRDGEFSDANIGGSCIVSSPEDAKQLQDALESKGWTVSVKTMPSGWIRDL